MVTRSDPEKHREQVRAANKARYRAIQILVARHQGEFDVLYAEQAEVEGVTPKPRGRIDVVGLERQVKELQGRLATLTQSSDTSA
jgi:hypothetical protein